jgi:hypothetical protein
VAANGKLAMQSKRTPQSSVRAERERERLAERATNPESADQNVGAGRSDGAVTLCVAITKRVSKQHAQYGDGHRQHTIQHHSTSIAHSVTESP